MEDTMRAVPCLPGDGPDLTATEEESIVARCIPEDWVIHWDTHHLQGMDGSIIFQTTAELMRAGHVQGRQSLAQSSMRSGRQLAVVIALGAAEEAVVAVQAKKEVQRWDSCSPPHH